MNKGLFPYTASERIVHYSIVLTWVFYLFGALYVVGPVLAWGLGVFSIKAILRESTNPNENLSGNIHWLVWLWWVSMMVMLIALWAGHLNWNLGTGTLIKSTIGWAKGWALIPLFIMIGAILPIRKQVVVRAQTILGLQVLCVLPILIIGPLIGLPPKIFVSPLKALGGPGPEYFSVYLYTIDPSSGGIRWQFFAPWSPFAGLLGVLMVVFSIEEKSRRLMLCGVLGGLAMILLSKSRMSLAALPFSILLPRMMPFLLKTWAWQIGAILTASMAAFYIPLRNLFIAFITAFREARGDSTRVRDALQRIAKQRWQSEAYWFGHGRVERGPHIVEYMPIGSHHTWYGLLFVKGLVGFLAFLVPFLVHFLVLLKDAIFNERARLPLSIYLIMVVLTFGENIEIEVYLLWPALVVLGIHLRMLANDLFIADEKKLP